MKPLCYRHGTAHPVASLAGMTGFTLIEILVAMTLLAIVSLLAYRGLEAVRQQARALEQRHDRWQDIGRSLNRIGHDLQKALPRHPDHQGQPLPPLQGDAGSATRSAIPLALIHPGHDAHAPHRLAYQWQANRINLLYWSDTDAARIPEPYLLLDGVTRLELAYLDASGQWHDQWPPAPTAVPVLPRAVRLRLELAEGFSLERLVDLPNAP